MGRIWFIHQLLRSDTSEQTRRDLSCNDIRRSAERSVGEVRIALGRGCLAMTEDAANERQSHASSGAEARIGVPQIMDSDICDPCLAADALPLLVEAIKVPLASLAGENP